MSKGGNVKTIIFVGLFASIIYLTTAYLFHIPTGMNNGYIHLGDAFIYLAASLLPMPYAMASVAIGAGLADLLTGATAWVLPTIIIKPLLVIWFTSKADKIVVKRNIGAVFIAAVVGLLGYGLAEGTMYGNFLTPLIKLPISALQPIGCGILYILVGFAFDRIKLKSQLVKTLEER